MRAPACAPVGSDPIYYITAIHFLACDAFERAMETYEQALEYRLKAHGPMHSGVAECYMHMARALDDRGAFDDAAVFYEKAYHITCANEGPCSQRAAYISECMAMVKTQQNQAGDALMWYDRQLKINPSDVHSASTDYAIEATRKHQSGKFAAAIALLQRAVQIAYDNHGKYTLAAAEYYADMSDAATAMSNPGHAIMYATQSRAVLGMCA